MIYIAYVPYTPISNILLDCLRVNLAAASCTLHSGSYWWNLHSVYDTKRLLNKLTPLTRPTPF